MKYIPEDKGLYYLKTHFLYILIITQAHTFVCGTDIYTNHTPSQLKNYIIKNTVK
jgi:hypothetical protein